MTSRSQFGRMAAILVLVAMVGISVAGCKNAHYTANRKYDFYDIWNLGVGFGFENPKTGPWPPALGVHAQVSDYVNLGAMHFSGYKIERDGRGFFKGMESRTRFGFLPMQSIRIDQDYVDGEYNYFKRDDTLWARRLDTTMMRFKKSPAKDLNYRYWRDELHKGAPLFHRGWQYWLNSGLEIGVCDPFFTHLGLNLQIGFDMSEVSDWILGYWEFDFKGDDLTALEYEEMVHGFVEEAGEPVAGVSMQITGPAEVIGEGARLQTVYFDYNSARIRRDQVTRLGENAEFLLDHPSVNVLIEGHCDERGNDTLNYELGERRAQAARDFLADRGITTDRMNVVSRGESQPAAAGSNEAAWARNRRAEFILKK
jgi:outer membrane protein OmpA-like peptidoglycan-associated protein